MPVCRNESDQQVHPATSSPRISGSVRCTATRNRHLAETKQQTVYANDLQQAYRAAVQASPVRDREVFYLGGRAV